MPKRAVQKRVSRKSEGRKKNQARGGDPSSRSRPRARRQTSAIILGKKSLEKKKNISQNRKEMTHEQYSLAGATGRRVLAIRKRVRGRGGGGLVELSLREEKLGTAKSSANGGGKLFRPVLLNGGGG